MPIVLNIGVNSWVTMDEADNYFDSKYGAGAWATILIEERKQLLISAFYWISRLSSYVISAVTSNLKYAQIELAWYIYGNSNVHSKHEALQAQGVESFKISKFSERSTGKIGLPQNVKDLLSDYDLNSGGYFPLIEREIDQNE